MSTRVDDGAAGRALPRELVLASAGTGKTFRISSRIVGLLDLGAPVDDVFASTFTRKAAGEILERVLERLARAALDEEAARALADKALLRAGGGGPEPDPGRWQALLARLAEHLHRINVGTLDAFFIRTAGSFALELGLPPGWRIGDEATSTRLESEALEDVLADADRGEMLEMVRALMGGEATRSVHRRVLDKARGLRWLVHQVDPGAEDPWSPFPDVPRPATEKERLRAAARIEELEAPANKDDSPNATWTGELQRAADAVRAGEWDGILERGIGSKLLDGEERYARKPVEPAAAGAFRRALKLARRDLRADYARQARALGRLAGNFETALSERQRREGAYRFHDITRLVGGEDSIGARPDLWYRLDQRARHLLLDEFQDTSLPQWEALRPLVGELLSGHAEERAAVIVADPKQSIYGWRGAEPGLVHRLQRDFTLDEDRLRKSYRSSGRILDFVNVVFDGLDRSPFWAGAEEDRRLVRDWLRDFDAHQPAYDLPGRVRVEVGPREGNMRGDDRPRMMRRAAERVREVRDRAPDFSVGVLMRKNRNVPRLIAELRRLGLDASEEGGTHLTDSPAVATVLALLRMADHPGHSIARYHVAASPLGSLFGLDGKRDEEAARRVSREVRTALLQEGYGVTLDAYTRELGRRALLDRRDLRRLFQLVELGFRWDERGASLRPTDFVDFVETEKVEDPTAAGVRVMTIHQSKGLEFDVVVLPELDLSIAGGGPTTPAALPERDPSTGRIVRIFPYVKKSAARLLPETAAAAVQARASELRDALGVLYVGVTRARFGLHLLLAADSERGPSSASSFARLIRCALEREEEALEDGDVLYDRGTPDWPESVPDEHRRPSDEVRPPEPERVEVRLRDPSTRTRSLPHRSPSELAGGGRVALDELLDLGDDGRAEARSVGTVVHAWCQAIGWIDDEGVPDDETLLSTARRLATPLAEDELRTLLSDFRGWLEAPAVRDVFRRPQDGEFGTGEGVRAEAAGPLLERERPFAVRREDEIVEGVIDRVVVSGRAARVVDFKTDRVDPGDASALAAKVEGYRPQLEAYRMAVARMHGLETGAVEAHLVFLRTGVVETLP